MGIVTTRAHRRGRARNRSGSRIIGDAYIHVDTIHIYIYIYIYREREREREKSEPPKRQHALVSVVLRPLLRFDEMYDRFNNLGFGKSQTYNQTHVYCVLEACSSSFVSSEHIQCRLLNSLSYHPQLIFIHIHQLFRIQYIILIRHCKHLLVVVYKSFVAYLVFR